MKILLLKVTLRASWVHSLKEKRMVIKSLMQRLKNKFNVSVAEVDSQDVHQTLVIGISCVSDSKIMLDSVMENILDFIECNTDAEIINIEQDIDSF